MEQIDLIKDELIRLHKEKAKFVTLTYAEHKKYHEIYGNEINEETYKEYKALRKKHFNSVRLKKNYRVC